MNNEINFEILASVVEDVTKISKDKLISKVRTRELVELRMICSNVLKNNHENLTVNMIGSMLQIDHSTVSYYGKSSKTLMSLKNNNYKNLYETINTEYIKKLTLSSNAIREEFIKRKKELEKMLKEVNKFITIIDNNVICETKS